MAHISTVLVLTAIGWFGFRSSPELPPLPEAPDGLAVTPLRVHMAADGDLGIDSWPGGDSAIGLEAAMQAAQQSLPESVRQQLDDLRVFPFEGLFNGWLRMRVDPATPFGGVWWLFMDPGRDTSVYKFVFDGSEGAAPVFVQMPVELDWTAPEHEPAVWLIQGAARSSSTSAPETGIRHAFGRYLGNSTMAVANYFTSAEVALAAIGEETPRLVVDPDVPWSEVEPVLRGLAKNGISWWPVLAEGAGLIQVEERYVGFDSSCIGPKSLALQPRGWRRTHGRWSFPQALRERTPVGYLGKTKRPLSSS